METKFVEIPNIGARCVVPSTRTLAEILADVVRHGVENPRHGTNCACMDKFVWEIKAHLHKAIPARPNTNDEWNAETREMRDRRYDAEFRVAHVIELAARGI